jgi:hypothetical protein
MACLEHPASNAGINGATNMPTSQILKESISTRRETMSFRGTYRRTGNGRLEILGQQRAGIAVSALLLAVTSCSGRATPGHVGDSGPAIDRAINRVIDPAIAQAIDATWAVDNHAHPVEALYQLPTQN